MKKKERRSEKHRHLCVLLRWAVAEVIPMVAVSCCRELDSVPPEVVSTQRHRTQPYLEMVYHRCN